MKSLPDSEENIKIHCVRDTDAFMGYAVGAMFVQQNFREESKQLAESMANAIKGAFKNNLDNLDWMDDETREAAKDKADAIINFIGSLLLAYLTRIPVNK